MTEQLQADPQPVAVVANADAPTLPEPAVAAAAAPQTLASVAAAPPAGNYPTSASFGADDQKDGPNWLMIGGIAAAIAALIIGIVAFTGGGGNTETTVSATRTDIDADEPTVEAADAPTSAPGQDEPTAAPQQQAEPTTAPTEVPEPTATPEPTAAPLTATGQPEQPFVQGSNGNPILNRLPLDFDDSLVDSPWAPSPCPLEQPLVACFIGVIDATAEEDDNLSATWFTLGFTPELEPADLHLHFYIPELIDGDETKAGTATPGGAWKEWDGPWPATSFGGDSGRTLYTMADFRAAGSTTMCVIVADADHQAIPGSGNCAPVVSDADIDHDKFLFAVDRLEGRWIGSCADRVTAIVPEDWRWYSLNELTPGEVASQIRPTAIDEITALLETFEAQGGVLWAEGPVVRDFIVNLSFSIIPGGFGLTDDPRAVADTLAQLGVPTSNGGQRLANGRNLYFERTANGNSSTSATYVIPDHGYAIAMTFTAPDGAGLNELADQVAYTVSGC